MTHTLIAPTIAKLLLYREYKLHLRVQPQISPKLIKEINLDSVTTRIL